MKAKKIDWKKLLLHIALPLSIGGLSALLSSSDMKKYADLNQPPLAPPGFFFPIVWTVLYILMGISTYLISKSSATTPQKDAAYRSYGLQLFFNFIWPLIFFKTGAVLAAFICLILLIAAILKMLQLFHAISSIAANLQIPYLCWCLFAAYLNFGIYLLN
ncbi:MAG: tryptophan-rich sensory protein [Peptococcaceae bacterium]|nr:tryptophan-rich sensory protein [Peptococcaceae bacterium]